MGNKNLVCKPVFPAQLKYADQEWHAAARRCDALAESATRELEAERAKAAQARLDFEQASAATSPLAPPRSRLDW
jgi:hypothetical protein